MHPFRWLALLWLAVIFVPVDTRGADTQPWMSISSVTLPEGNAGYTDFVFTVSLSAPGDGIITVHFETLNYTAVAPGDYAAIAGTLTFDPGQTSQKITVRVTGDPDVEDDELFSVFLDSAVGATLDRWTFGTGTIVSDEPTITIQNVFQPEGDAGMTDFVFHLNLSEPMSREVAVPFYTRDGSGTVKGRDYVATAGVVRFPPGVTMQTITVKVFGNTTYSYLPRGFILDLKPIPGVRLAPGRVSGVIVNDDPVPTFSVSDVTQAEGVSGTTAFVFDVTLSAPVSHEVWVRFVTANGTAVSPDDYAARDPFVRFRPGELLQKVSVKVAGDAGFEPTETFLVNLERPGNGPTLGDRQGVGTIVNDDDPPLVKVVDVIEVEENEDTSFVFKVTLSAPSFQPVTVDYETADDTAGEDDYTPAAGALEFEPGATLRTITVPVLGDTLYEHDERFFVKLANVSGAAIANRGEGWIQNDDAMPALSVGDVTRPAATSLVFDVSLSAPSGIRTTVDFATSDGTATAPGDYTASSGTLIFEPGEMLRTITVAVAGDSAVEPAETLFVTLSNPHGALLADEQGIGTITADAPVFADLSVVNIGPAWAYAGGTIHYLVTVTNAGPEAATNVAFTDALPAGATLLSATPSQGTCAGTTTVTCTLGTIDNGSSAAIDLMVMAPLACGESWNTAAAQSDQIDPTVAAATASTVVVGRERRRG